MNQRKVGQSNRVTVITDANAKPQNEKEMAETIQALVNANKGSNGDGTWDGGVDGATGYWSKYRMFWDAKLVFTASGSITVTLPFTVVDNTVRVIKCGTTPAVEVLYYLERSKTISLTGLNGKTVIELSMVKNIKED